MNFDFSKLLQNMVEESKKKLKGFHFVKIDMEKATHWLAYEDSSNKDNGITPFQFYRLFLDKYDDEYVIFDDNNVNTTAYMWHEGEFVRLEKIEKV